MAKLIVRFPNNEIKEVEFDSPKFTIGSAEDNNLVLENEDVAPHQAVIETQNNVFTLIDLTEDKTTLVNGKKIDRVNLTYGDRISFGPVVALFYPSKKSKISDKIKMLLYLSAGAVIIIVSILIIFLLITPKISSTVSKSLGGTYLEEKVTKGTGAKSGVIKERIYRENLKEIVRKGERKEEQVAGAPEEKQGGLFKKIVGLFSRFGRNKTELTLPEPSKEDIAQRDAVAIPTGLKRLFFRKRPVYVEPETKGVQKTGKQGAYKEVAIKPGEEHTEKYTAEEQALQTPKEGGISNIPAGEQAGAGGEKRSIFSKVISPFKKLFKGKGKKEEVAIEEEAEGQEKEEVPVAPAGLEKPLNEKGRETLKLKAKTTAPEIKSEIENILNPIAAINRIEVSELKKRLPGETPVYSKEELRSIEKRDIYKKIKLSNKESTGFDLMWIYPSALNETGVGKTVYSGTVGRIDRNRYPDFIFSTKNGKITILDGREGGEIYQLELNEPVYAPVVARINGNRYSDFILTYKNGRIEAYSDNFERLWYTVLEHAVTSAPLVIDVNGDGIDDIVVPELGMEIAAIDGKTGFQLWKFPDLGGDVASSPAGVDVNGDKIKDVAVNGDDGYLYLIDGKTGWGLWKRKIFGLPTGSPVISDVDGDGVRDILTLTKNGILTAFSSTGRRLFTINLEGRFQISPSAGDLDRNGKVDIVVMNVDGAISAVEAKTRRKLWTFETEELTSFGRIALADINMDKALDVVVSVPSGVVMAIDGKTGTLLAEYNVNDYLFATPVVFDINHDKYPEIITVSYSGVIYCIRLSDVKKPLLYLAKSYWLSEGNITNDGFSKVYNKLKFWH